MKKNVAIITNIAPLYRLPLYSKILNNKNYNCHFYLGKDNHSGIKQIDFENENIVKFQNLTHFLKNIYYRNKILIWQRGIVKTCLVSTFDAAVITGDLFVISNWLIALILRLKGTKVIFWSHGFYGNESKIKKWIRTLFFSLAHEHLLYERRGKNLMINAGFERNKLHVIFNSLDYEQSLRYRESFTNNLAKEEVYPFFLNSSLPTLIFIGRLTKIKKLDMLIEAIKKIELDGRKVNLLLVGDGNEKTHLINLIRNQNFENQCYLFGPCYSEEQLSKLISNADLCVSPGNVGLTAIHSMSYGTPVLTHGNFANQMPEVGAIKEGYNGLFFEENDFNSLSENIFAWIFQNKLSRDKIRKNCYQVIDLYYNPDYQVKVIENLLKNNPPLKTDI